MRFSKAIIPIALCILLMSLAVPAQRQKGRAATPRKPIVVTSIDLEALKGLLTQPREHPLLINFWATYCDPCREEFPDLVKIDRDYRPRALEFVTISLDAVEDIKTGVPKFLGSMKATMPAYLLDIPDPQLAIDLIDPRWQGSLPATFLYNEKGEMVYKKIGRVKEEELRAELEKVVKKPVTEK
ncbi:MAG TPA: TlpA disulfide reductase family protein [Pyrinomonadaceae bacterium]|nr:TlpA disulfide reductase family protein [Pyrinomonadaceae bacterium]